MSALPSTGRVAVRRTDECVHRFPEIPIASTDRHGPIGLVVLPELRRRSPRQHRWRRCRVRQSSSGGLCFRFLSTASRETPSGTL